MAQRITDKLVKGLTPPEAGNRITYDDTVSGFGVRVTAAGARSFVLNYRNQEGRDRRVTIGTYGPVWSVEAARRRAVEYKKDIARGGDPLAMKIEVRTAPTVADLCDRYIADHLPRKRPASRRDDEAMIRKTIKPAVGSRKVAAVKHADIDDLHRKLKATPYRANRILSLLSKMFSLAIKWGWRPDNPCRGVERFPEHKRTRYLSPAEIAALGKALAEYENQKAANVVRLCLLTGCRSGEAMAATWGQFDLERGEWVKPAANTKQDLEHRVPLSDAAMLLLKGILAAAERTDDGALKSQFVFPGRRPDKRLSEIKDEWREIATAAGLRDEAGRINCRVHDLRHTFASMLVSGGASLPMIGALLGHTQVSTTARYAHLASDPLRKAADHVGAIVTGQKPAEVVELRKGGAA